MNPMWMIGVSLAAVAVLFGVFVLQHRLARRRKARSPLPPLCTTDQHAATPLRGLTDVHGWDETPQGGNAVDLDGTVAAGADPSLVDRER